MTTFIFDLIRETARSDPLRLAVAHGNKKISYGELEQAVVRLSHSLISRGCGPGFRIPVLASSCPEAIVAFLAIVDTGACYIPIDVVNWSDRRIRAVLDSTSPPFAICTELQYICPYDLEILSLDDPWNQTPFQTSHSAPATLFANAFHERAAYIIFTSGTTGLPKGVVVSVENVMHYVRQGDPDAPFNMGVTSDDIVLSILSVAFDGRQTLITYDSFPPCLVGANCIKAYTIIAFSTLCKGGALLLSNPSTFVRDSQMCTVLPITPSLLRTISPSDQHKQLRAIFLGGESPDPRLISQWKTDRRRMFNGYGATETTCTCLMAELQPGCPITLGTCIPGSQVLLLDEDLQEADEGEIAIQGKAVVMGYLQDNQNIQNQFSNWKGQKIYRTGDFACRTDEGLMFLGRKDAVVKNRNIRINIEIDIVPAIRNYEGVASTVAFMYDDQLVAFVTPSSLDTARIRRTLQQDRDAFLVPDIIKAVDTMPLNANGKADIGSLKELLNEAKLGPGTATSMPVSTMSDELKFLLHSVATALDLRDREVTPEASFWDLGGNSLSAIKLLSLLHTAQLTTSLKTLLTLPLWSVSRNLRPIRDLESNAHDNSSAKATPLQVQMVRSLVQNKRAAHIFLELNFDIRNSLTTAATLEHAFKSVFNRHDIFCSGINMTTGDLIRDARALCWCTTLVSPSDFDNTCQSLSRNMLGFKTRGREEEISYPTNLLHLISSEQDQMTLLWLVHHSLIDGWSIAILMQELEAVLLNKSLGAAPSFLDFARCRERHASDSERHSFSNVELQEQMPLFGAFKRPDDMRSMELREILPLTLPHLENVTRELGVSSASIFYTAWAILLANYTGNEHVKFGSVLSGRSLPLPSISSIVGPVINVCLFAIDIPHEGSLSSILYSAQQQLFQIQESQWMQDGNYVDSTASSDQPQYDTLLAVELDLSEISRSTTLADMPLKITRRDFPDLPLVAYIELYNDNISCKFVLDSHIGEKQGKQLLKHFCNITKSLVFDSSRTIQEARSSMFTKVEGDALLQRTEPSISVGNQASDLKTAFERAVDKWPAIVAIEQNDLALTYSQLEFRANIVAQVIHKKVRPGQVVSLISDGSPEWIITIFAIIKAGAIYAPVDVELPTARIEHMLKSSNAALCLVPNEICERRMRAVPCSCPTLRTDRMAADGSRLSVNIRSSSPAYLIFTSGSTGMPKPVLAKHGAILSLLSSLSEVRLYSQPGRRIGQTFSVGFDVSIAEIFGTLCYGGTLVLKDPNDLIAHLKLVDATMATPSLLAALDPTDYPNLDTVLLVGEAVPQCLVGVWARHVRLFNGYGPCECTILSSLAELKVGQQVTIGKPVPGSKIYILNSWKRPVPIGAIGELCVSGIYVASGYVNRGLSDNTKFVPDPFDPGSTMYCTGDLGAWTDGLDIVFHGRLDNQVKIRGYRVELEEVENAIRSLSVDVKHAGAFVVHDQLFAAVSPVTVNAEEVLKGLVNVLPHYAIPSQILALEELPLSANQKLDRIALKDGAKEIILEALQMKEGVSHRQLTPTEQLVTSAWKEVLGLPSHTHIAPHDSFLHLGGHSLRQIRLLPKLARLFDRAIPLRLVINHPFLEDLASAIDTYIGGSPISRNSFLEYCRNTKVSDLTLVTTRQVDLFEIWSKSSYKSACDIVTKLVLTGKVDLQRLRASINVSLQKHRILRSIYSMENGRVIRKLLTDPPQVFCHVPNRDLEKLLSKPTDIMREHPVTVFLEFATSCSLTFKMHHIVGDKTSINRLLQDISDSYRQNTENLGIAISTAPDYLDYASWAASNQLPPHKDDLDFWKDILRDTRNLLPSSTKEIVFPAQGNTIQFPILWHADANIKLQYCLAATSFAVFNATAQRDFLIGVSYMDRSGPGTESMIGLFLDAIPIRFPTVTSLSELSPSLLKNVQKSMNSALSHPVPSSTLKKVAETDRLFDVMVTLNRKEDSFGETLDLPGVLVEEEHVRMPGARFPILIEFEEEEDRLECYIEYAVAFINDSQIAMFKAGVLDAFSTLLDSLHNAS